MKSEPEVYSIDDLAKNKETLWEGVRNYMARNFMTQKMKLGDLVLFYHSNSKPSSVVGVAVVSSKAIPDPTQFEPQNQYFDAKSKVDNPRWHCVRLKFKSKLNNPVSLEKIKNDRKLKKMVLLNNSRLSVQPVTKQEFDRILELSKHQ